MSDKKRTSITLDEDVYQYLKQSEINQSGLINELVKEYRNSEDRQVAALELQYERLISDAEDLEDRAEQKRQEAKEVKELLEEARHTEDERVEEAVQTLKAVPNLTPDNPAVANWSEKTGLSPSELIDKVHSTQ